MQLTKFQWFVFVSLALVTILGMTAFGMNQVMNIAEKFNATEKMSAEAACVFYGWPHAVIGDDGEVFCFTIYAGSERTIPLEFLHKAYEEEQGGLYGQE